MPATLQRSRTYFNGLDPFISVSGAIEEIYRDNAEALENDEAHLTVTVEIHEGPIPREAGKNEKV